VHLLAVVVERLMVLARLVETAVLPVAPGLGWAALLSGRASARRSWIGGGSAESDAEQTGQPHSGGQRRGTHYALEIHCVNSSFVDGEPRVRLTSSTVWPGIGVALWRAWVRALHPVTK